MTGENGHRPDWVDPALYPFEDRWITIDGHRIHYVDEGPRDAPVLLFVHPQPGWSFSYRFQISGLRTAFRCVAPDLPGCGLSEAAAGYGYTLQEQARVLAGFVAALDLKDLTVWANDGGGPTAVLALAPVADRVKGLVVGGTFGWSLEDYPYVTKMIRRFSGRIPRAINRRVNMIGRSMGSSIALGTRRMSRAEKRHYVRPMDDGERRDAPLRIFRSFMDPATEAALNRSIDAFREKAALIQFGERDPMTAQGWPERWAKEIPDHRLVILPRAKHFPFEDAPELTIRNFESWWADRNGPGAS